MLNLTSTQKKNLLVQVPATFITVTLMILLPFLVHFIPLTGKTPLGARLLPIFYAPLAAIFLSHPLVSVASGLIAPYLNYLLTGQPTLAIAPALSVELVIFSATLVSLNHKKQTHFWAAPAAFGLARLGSGLVTYLMGSFSLGAWLAGLGNAWPGLIILILIHTWFTRRVGSSHG